MRSRILRCRRSGLESPAYIHCVALRRTVSATMTLCDSERGVERLRAGGGEEDCLIGADCAVWVLGSQRAQLREALRAMPRAGVRVHR